MKTVWLKRILWACVLLPSLVMAKEYKEGVHYTRLAQDIQTMSGDKIEVLEFFWYGCPHCYQFEPTISKWKKNKPDNVHFMRMPSPLNPRWMVHTKTYYTLELMGKLEQMHAAIFEAMHMKRMKLFTQSAITDFLVSKGIDKKLFTDTFNSFAVEMRARKALQVGQSYRLNGVPMLAVNGKYIVSAEKAGSFQEMVNITNYLIRKEAKTGN